MKLRESVKRKPYLDGNQELIHKTKNKPGGSRLRNTLLAIGALSGIAATDAIDAAAQKRGAGMVERRVAPGFKKDGTPTLKKGDGKMKVWNDPDSRVEPKSDVVAEENPIAQVISYSKMLQETPIASPADVIRLISGRGRGGERPRVPEYMEKERNTFYPDVFDRTKRAVMRMNLQRGGNQPFTITAVRVGEKNILTSVLSMTRLLLGQNDREKSKRDSDIAATLPPHGMSLTIQPTVPALRGEHARALTVSPLPEVADEHIGRGAYATAVGERLPFGDEQAPNYDSKTGVFFLSGFLMPSSETVIRDMVIRQLRADTIQDPKLDRWLSDMVSGSHFLMGEKAEAQWLQSESQDGGMFCLPVYAAVKGLVGLQRMGYASFGPILITEDGTKVTFDKDGRSNVPFVPVYLVQGRERVQRTLNSGR